MKKNKLLKTFANRSLESDNSTTGSNKSGVVSYAVILIGVFCIALAVFIIKRNINTPLAEHDQPAIYDESKLETFALSSHLSYGMGYEGYYAYDIDELTSENPWTEESEITHLPVIENAIKYNDKHLVENPDFDAMEKLLKDTAAKLGMDIDNLTIINDSPDEEERIKIIEKFEAVGSTAPEEVFEISKLILEDSNIKVEVYTTMEVKVTFEPGLALPARYNFTDDASYDQIYRVAKYLQKQYRDYIGMDNPIINIEGGYYSRFGDQRYNISFFDDSEDEIQKIMNFEYNRVTFACNGEGELFISRIFKPDLTNVIGYYPIISVDAALELLGNKNYVTTVSGEFPGMDFERKTELVYRNWIYDEISVPYYRIYVELTDRKLDNGLNTYGAYYVPAVEGKYIENMPLWDGRFN
jgi:hypothetical protein